MYITIIESKLNHTRSGKPIIDVWVYNTLNEAQIEYYREFPERSRITLDDASLPFVSEGEYKRGIIIKASKETTKSVIDYVDDFRSKDILLENDGTHEDWEEFCRS